MGLPDSLGETKLTTLVEQNATSDTIQVLIADDHELTRFTLKLEVARYQLTQCVGTVNNGKAAVEMVSQCHPDVVILDLQMPLMDGASASQEIKKRFPTTTIIAYTSLCGESLQAYLQRGQFDAYYKKEDDLKGLLGLISQAKH